MGARTELIVMGGSWGGISSSISVLSGLPAQFPIPIVLVLHRLKNFESGLLEIYRKKIILNFQEVEDKEKIQKGVVYIAPANYHLLFEKDKTFSLDVSEHENYSRPSIDVTFSSAADIYGPKLTGILLSGANKDGSRGLKYIVEKGGTAIVQDPAEAEVAIMPESAIAHLKPHCFIYSLKEIQHYLLSLI
jgi:two-component system, chemotaxis family, protein-glutamate methylesterase/glutaminase